MAIERYNHLFFLARLERGGVDAGLLRLAIALKSSSSSNN